MAGEAIAEQRHGNRARILVSAAAVLLAFAALAVRSTAAASPSSVSFTGGGIGYDVSGTFTLDHFEVKTPVSFPNLPTYVPSPRLVAVGTVTATRVGGPGGIFRESYTNAPFVWVNLSVNATCGGSVDVSFDPVGGSDYVGFGPIGGLPLWDPSVPLAPWDGSIHWGMSSAGGLTLSGPTGLSCAVARVGSLVAQAKTLNALLRSR
jgi:hypothetical protein